MRSIDAAGVTVLIRLASGLEMIVDHGVNTKTYLPTGAQTVTAETPLEFTADPRDSAEVREQKRVAREAVVIDKATKNEFDVAEIVGGIGGFEFELEKKTK